MKIFVEPTAAPAPKTANVALISLALAACLIILAVAQLYKYEDFPSVIKGFGLSGGAIWASLYAAVIVIGEVLAVPFLLRMPLSPAMRIVSMVSGWLVIVGWLVIALVNNITGYVGNSGILGATIPVVSGWWTVFVFIALGVLAVWSAWGMWPCRSVTVKH
jgi:hypothetical protein